MTDDPARHMASAAAKARLGNAVHHLRAGAGGKLSQFVKRFFGIYGGTALPVDTYQNRAILHKGRGLAPAGLRVPWSADRLRNDPMADPSRPCIGVRGPGSDHRRNSVLEN
jgi:hypothetical protein